MRNPALWTGLCGAGGTARNLAPRRYARLTPLCAFGTIWRMTPEPALLTTAQAARRLGVNPATVRRWADSGHLRVHFTTPGGRRRYTPADVDALRTPERAAS